MSDDNGGDERWWKTAPTSLLPSLVVSCTLMLAGTTVRISNKLFLLIGPSSMASSPPSGYGYWAATIQTTGAPHLSVVTCGFNNAAFLTAAQANIALRGAMNNALSPFTPTNMAGAFTMLSTYVLINTGAGLYADTINVAVVGSKTLQTPSINNALVIKKNTILAGRQFRGRFMVPPMNVDEAQVTIAGQITGTSLTNANAQWAAFHTYLTGANIPPVLLHEAPKVGPTPAPTAVSSFTATPLIGTIKRRIRT